MSTIEDDLINLADQILNGSAGPLRLRPPRRAPRGAIAIVVLLLVAGGGLAVRRNASHKERVNTASPDVTVSTSAEVTRPAPPDITRLSAAPISGREGANTVDTPFGLFIWGGTVGRNARKDGAIYSAASDTWTVVPDAPISGRVLAAVVWTGAEVLVVGGSDDVRSTNSGAAYNPFTKTWRTIPDAPTSAVNGAIWDGTEMIAVGLTDPDTVSYNPATDSWRVRARAPGAALSASSPVWTGGRAIFAVESFGPGLTGVVLASFDPATDTWQELTKAPDDSTSSHLVGSASELLWLQPEPELQSLVYSPEKNEWSALALLPDGAGTRSPGSQSAFTWGGGQAFYWHDGSTLDIYDRLTNSWSTHTTPGLTERTGSAAGFTNDRAVFWSGRESTAATDLTRSDGIVAVVARPASVPTPTRPVSATTTTLGPTPTTSFSGATLPVTEGLAEKARLVVSPDAVLTNAVRVQAGGGRTDYDLIELTLPNQQFAITLYRQFAESELVDLPKLKSSVGKAWIGGQNAGLTSVYLGLPNGRGVYVRQVTDDASVRRSVSDLLVIAERLAPETDTLAL
jgi:hypothetical protein